jgi:hypothetical protein
MPPTTDAPLTVERRLALAAVAFSLRATRLVNGEAGGQTLPPASALPAGASQ